jgi:hypothetical protein
LSSRLVSPVVSSPWAVGRGAVNQRVYGPLPGSQFQLGVGPSADTDCNLHHHHHPTSPSLCPAEESVSAPAAGSNRWPCERRSTLPASMRPCAPEGVRVCACACVYMCVCMRMWARVRGSGRASAGARCQPPRVSGAVVVPCCCCCCCQSTGCKSSSTSPITGPTVSARSLALRCRAFSAPSLHILCTFSAPSLHLLCTFSAPPTVSARSLALRSVRRCRALSRGTPSGPIFEGCEGHG